MAQHLHDVSMTRRGDFFLVFFIHDMIHVCRVHSPEQLPGLLRFVNVARVQGPHVLGSVTQGLVELKLDNEADKVPGGRGDDKYTCHKCAY